MTDTPRPTRQPAAARRRAREREILKATRELFDENGVRDAQIEDIARAVGVNRAIIYRHFSGKEELFALTLVSYLEELETRLTAASAREKTPKARLVAVTEAFIDFGVEYPAFVDCAQTLMRRPGPELLEEISESSLFRLGRGISACLTQPLFQRALGDAFLHEAVEQKSRGSFVGARGDQIIQRYAANDKASSFAIDIRQACFRGVDIFKTVVHACFSFTFVIDWA